MSPAEVFAWQLFKTTIPVQQIITIAQHLLLAVPLRGEAEDAGWRDDLLHRDRRFKELPGENNRGRTFDIQVHYLI